MYLIYTYTYNLFLLDLRSKWAVWMYCEQSDLVCSGDAHWVLWFVHSVARSSTWLDLLTSNMTLFLNQSFIGGALLCRTDSRWKYLQKFWSDILFFLSCVLFLLWAILWLWMWHFQSKLDYQYIDLSVYIWLKPWWYSPDIKKYHSMHKSILKHEREHTL